MMYKEKYKQGLITHLNKNNIVKVNNQMETSAEICILTKDGKLKGVHCNYDGYPYHTGKILLQNYNTETLVTKLLSLGDICVLEAKMDKPAGHSWSKPLDGYTLFYGRDRGEDNVRAKKYDSVEDVFLNNYILEVKYVYVFDTNNNSWYFCEPKGELKSLTKDDVKDDVMAKGGGIKKGNYSYIPQEEIDYLVTEYGKKIDGNKLLDGAYAKGNTKAPKITRTQFEEEDYEYGKGGGVDEDISHTEKIDNLTSKMQEILSEDKIPSYEAYKVLDKIKTVKHFNSRNNIKNILIDSGLSEEYSCKVIDKLFKTSKMASGGSMGSRVNYQNDDFALVMLGGSIGSKTSLPIFVNGKMGSIVESGNNKEMLKEKAARMRKQLSAGERKHYGMSYTVVALTPAKVKEIERLKNK